MIDKQIQTKTPLMWCEAKLGQYLMFIFRRQQVELDKYA